MALTLHPGSMRRLFGARSEPMKHKPGASTLTFLLVLSVACLFSCSSQPADLGKFPRILIRVGGMKKTKSGAT